jgi:hypothetical protein
MHLTVNLAMHKSSRVRAAFVCLCAMAAGRAAAQHEAIEVCRDTPTDAARIACLEAALAGAAAVPRAGDNARQGRKPAHVRSRSVPEKDAGAASDSAVDVPSERRNSDAAHENRQPADPAADSIGARQVRARQERDTDLESAASLKVARYTQVPYRRLQVTLENGQVWRQIAGDTQRIRADLRRNQTVDINESRLGGYQLRLNEMERTIRVERIR